MSTPPVVASPQLAKRYGTPRAHRPAAYVAVGVLAALGILWVVWAGLHHSSPAVDGGLVSWAVRSDRAVDVTVEVRKAAGARVTCEILARDIDHVPVGQTAVEVAGSRRRLVVPATLATERRAVSAELTGCRPAAAR